MICPKCNIDDKFGCDCIPDEFTDTDDKQNEVHVTIGDRKMTVLVGISATEEEMSRAIVEAINNDHDCLVSVFMDEAGAICQSPLEEFVLEASPELRIPTISTGFFAEKKGRRRGQRQNDRNW